jgi:predicted nucleic acid-binding Zn ribbon protein
MERAARLIKNNKFSQGVFTDDDFARAIWPEAVGKAIASHTVRLKLVRTTLVVEVEDAIWQKQLHLLTRQILDRLRKVTSSSTIEDLEFRIAIPRRQPQRAPVRETTAIADEAESIQDPVLKKLYRLSRKKATA